MADDARTKTQKKSFSDLDVTGALALGFSEKTFQMLNLDAGNALKRPWHKLERGLRIGRLRDFSAREAEKLKLSEEDQELLFKLLCRGLDRKMLSSKAAVTYDHMTEQVLEIKGLVTHTTASGQTRYQLLEKKSGTTQKKRVKDSPTMNSNEE
jgi:hypothetical protein